MGAIASQISGLTIVYPIVYSGADQRKHESSASLASVREIHRVPVNYKWPVTRKMFPFDDGSMDQNGHDLIMTLGPTLNSYHEKVDNAELSCFRWY